MGEFGEDLGSLGHSWMYVGCLLRLLGVSGVFFRLLGQFLGLLSQLSLAFPCFSCLPWLSSLSLAFCFALLSVAACATDFRYSFLRVRAVRHGFLLFLPSRPSRGERSERAKRASEALWCLLWVSLAYPCFRWRALAFSCVACSTMVCLLSLLPLALPCVTCFNSPKTISILLLHASTTLICLRASRSLLRQVKSRQKHI